MTERRRLIITDDDMGLPPSPPVAAAPMAPPAGPPPTIYAGPAAPPAAGFPPVLPPGERLWIDDVPAANAAPAAQAWAPPVAAPAPPPQWAPPTGPPVGFPGAPPQGPPVGPPYGGYAPQPGVPAGLPGAYELADLLPRFGGALLDSAIRYLAGFIAFGAFYLLVIVAVLAALGFAAGGGVAVVFLVVGFSAIIAAFVWLGAGTMARVGPNNGQTYGMQAAGIRIVRENGEPFTWPSALFYWGAAGLILSITIVGGIVNLFWPLFDVRRQSLRDKIAKTVAVKA